MLARISKLLLLTIVVELCLGGGGRFTAIGPFSLRMILFGIALVFTLVVLSKGQTMAAHYRKLLAAFVVVIAVGIGVGVANGNPRGLIWEDVKPLLYFFMLPFFALAIGPKEVEDISAVYKTGPIFLAIGLFLMLLLIHTKLIPFLSFYQWTHDTQELFYRGELSFFYKGFLFLGVGIIFFFFTNSKRKKFVVAFLLAAILLSVTRGLVFSLAITFALYFFLTKKVYHSLICGVAALVILVWGNSVTMSLSQWMDSKKQQISFDQSSPHLFGDRQYSDDGRIAQVKEVFQSVTPGSFVYGHGFGQGTTSRPVHMEIAYLEVFHKQGIIGLAFWAALAALIFLGFRESNQSTLAYAFALSALFVFVESATNQYFNNPIGLSVLLLSLVSLDKLKKAG